MNAESSMSTTPKPLRLLILGGTGMIGPYHVRAAVARGHKVSVFNRGKGSSDLPAGVESLVGDRNGDLAAIQGRDWDAVIDMATYVPNWVRTLGQAIKQRAGHYTLISTIGVYDQSTIDAKYENGSVRTYKGSADPYTLTGPTEAVGQGDHGGGSRYCANVRRKSSFLERRSSFVQA